ncbi:hypothetical protein [Sulfuricurvum sp.]|uniref:hypothetical protein n=1 Tax=Sulfuricurvum sp. TaxID=2025608 RepID=UPI0035648BA6
MSSRAFLEEIAEQLGCNAEDVEIVDVIQPQDQRYKRKLRKILNNFKEETDVKAQP